MCLKFSYDNGLIKKKKHFPNEFGSMVVSGNLPTYHCPNLTFCPKKEVLMLGLGRGRWQN